MPNLKYLLSVIFVCTLLSANAQDTPSTRPNLDLLFQENYFETQLTTTTEGEIAERNPEDVLVATRLDRWSNGNITSQDSSSYIYNNEDFISEVNTFYSWTSGWRAKRQTKYSYNIKNKVSCILGKREIGASLVNDYKVSNVYNTSNQYITSTLEQFWENDDWLNYSKNSYEINDCGNTTTSILNGWIDEEWSAIFRNEFTYNENHGIDSKITFDWNESTSKWDNTSRCLYEYNSKKQLLKRTWQGWIESSASWGLPREFINSYTEFDSLSHYLWRNLRPDSTWSNLKQRLYGYDQNQNLVSYIEQVKNGDIWENDYRELNTYNIDNQIITQEIDDWNEDLAVWERRHSFELEYNARNNISKSTRHLVNENGLPIMHQTSYFYQPVQESIIGNTMVVFPNPNNGYFQIDFKRLNDNDKEIRVLDITGKLIYQTLIDKCFIKANLDLQYLPNGTYILSISNGELLTNQKIIITK